MEFPWAAALFSVSVPSPSLLFQPRSRGSTFSRQSDSTNFVLFPPPLGDRSLGETFVSEIPFLFLRPSLSDTCPFVIRLSYMPFCSTFCFPRPCPPLLASFATLFLFPAGLHGATLIPVIRPRIRVHPISVARQLSRSQPVPVHLLAANCKRLYRCTSVTVIPPMILGKWRKSLWILIFGPRRKNV